MGRSLSLVDLSVGVDGKIFLSGVSFAISSGQVAVLMGPNGAGKSSLLKAIAGHPDYGVMSGQILLDGSEICTLPPEERSRRGIFLAFQDPIELPGVTIAQMLKSAKQMRLDHGENFDVLAFYDELHGALDAMGMNRSWANRCVNEGFSGGEKKRCELLQILLLKPSFILLDEIDSGLDVDGISHVANVLRNLRDDGAAILLVTHHGKLLEFLQPDRVHVLAAGKVVYSGGCDVVGEIERSGFKTFSLS